MGQRCGAPNKTRPWPCRNPVTSGYCWRHGGAGSTTYAAPAKSPRPHRGGSGQRRRPRRASAVPAWGAGLGSSPRRWETEETAALLADVLTDGIKATVAKRVVDYLGRGGAFRLRLRRWGPGDCRLLAQTAKAVLDLKRKT